MDVIFSCLFSIITQGTSSFVHILISKQQLPNKLQLTWPLHDKYCSPNMQIHAQERQLEIFQGHTLSSTLNKSLKFTIDAYESNCVEGNNIIVTRLIRHICKFSNYINIENVLYLYNNFFKYIYLTLWYNFEINSMNIKYLVEFF